MSKILLLRCCYALYASQKLVQPSIMHANKLAVMQTIYKKIKIDITSLWQTSDFIPNIGSEGWQLNLQTFMQTAKYIDERLLAVLIDNTICEITHPLHQTSLNVFESISHDNNWVKLLQSCISQKINICIS